jgi:hypothetical protein
MVGCPLAGVKRSFCSVAHLWWSRSVMIRYDLLVAASMIYPCGWFSYALMEMILRTLAVHWVHCTKVGPDRLFPWDIMRRRSSGSGTPKKDHGNHGMHSGDFRGEHWYVGQIQLIPKSSVLSSCSALKPRVQLRNHPCSDQTTSLLPRKLTTLMPDFKDRDVEAQRISQSISSGKIWTYPFFDSPHQRVRIIYWILLIYSWSVFSKRICHLH